MKKIILNLLAILSVAVSLVGCSLLFPEDDDNPTSPTNTATTGESFTFYEAAGEKKVVATCRKVVSDINTNQGLKSLNIWVANDCWIDGGTKSKLITQTMVDAMANAFLKSGSDNDIYDWVTNICGAEWGSHSYSSILINNSQPINILLCDISDDEANGNTSGYFAPVNNFFKTYSSDVANSNQKIMFCVDAYYFADGSSSWSPSDANPKLIFSTLAHEFQHMIFYYQYNVLKKVSQEDWFNEMLAMSVEDLVAYKMFGNFLSSPYYLRFANFNANNFLPLCLWSGNYRYAIHYGFGSYLLRHYDGANFVKNVYDSRLVGDGTYETNSLSGTLDVSATLHSTGAVLIDNKSHPSINLTLNSTSAKTLYFIFSNATDLIVDSSTYSVSSSDIDFSSSVVNRSILNSSIDNGKILFKDAVLPKVPELPGCFSSKKSLSYSTTGTSNAVEAVTGKSFPTLQRYWGAAYLLSDQEGLSGDFAYNDDLSSEVGNVTYKLVSINAFTEGSPQIYTIGNKQDVRPRANVYYKVKDNFTSGTFAISLGNNLKLTVVAK